MKKIIYLLLVFSLFSVIDVQAYEKAKAPSSIPSSNTLMYGTRANDSDKFDFSNISFGDVTGKSEMYKIKISSGFSDSGTFNKKLNDNWFSAYCLDPSVKYPVYGISRVLNNKIASENISEMPNDQLIFESAVKATLFNSVNTSEVYNLFKKLNQYDFESEFEYTIPSEYQSSETKYKDMLNAIYNGTEVKIGFKKYTRTNMDASSSVTLTGSEINEKLNITGEEYELTLTNSDIFFDQYKTTNMGTSVNYNHVLWIIEHSYPTLSLAKLYEDAGVDVTTLNAELFALSGNSNLTEEEKIDGYIYSTVQYAIWHVLEIKVDGKTIGNTLTGSSELNKLYQYLIKDRSIYTNYNSKTFGSSLTISKPSGSAIMEETTSSIKYGPYTIKSDMITPGIVTLTLNDETYAKIIDKNGYEISTVMEGEKFYILVDKKIKSSSLVVTAITNDGWTFEPTSNRGKIYYSNSPIVQNVISGGIVKGTTASVTLDILVNVNTGIPNIALLFIVTMLIFSIGYILIVKFSKPMKLN